MKTKFLSCLISAALLVSGTAAYPCFAEDDVCAETVITEAELDELLPHTIEEYYVFVEENTELSIHGKYIIFCCDISGSTGEQVIAEQIGTGELKEIRNLYMKYSEPLPPGSYVKNVYVYEAVSPGDVEFKILKGIPWSWDVSKEEQAAALCKISDDLTIRAVSEDEFKENMRGDVNGDGEFTIADIAMLEGFLLGKSNELTNWQNADLCKDEVIDVFDLCVMKRDLIKQSYPKANIMSEDTFRQHGSIENIKDNVLYAKDLVSLKTMMTIQEGCKNEDCSCAYHDIENYIPEGIDESFFEKNDVIIVYNSAGAGNKTFKIDDLIKVDRYATIYTTTTVPKIATPDMAYSRIVMSVDKEWFSEVYRVIRKDNTVYEE